ncbi:DUF2027 domain-containing protein [Telluribacter sp. SYSU D00476]|uniref:Smr/MutS family protein n=1 Tax=Telluribacter sp. SYSU D00476 TaxID=2811430 RepID=UPI001FF37F7C|nr:DUF2027 domain-containing protein [Telluribacter sp. SYSU D00476]
MNIGDKVRLVHGREEGIISRFLPGNQVEIEIEDGFRIPVLRQEVVLVSPMEAQRLSKPPVKEEPRSRSAAPTPTRGTGVFAQKGIYLAFVPINDRELTVHLINNTDWKLPFTFATSHEGRHSGLAAGVLLPRTSQKMTDLLIKDFEAWPTFDLQALYHKEGAFEAREPFQKRLKCRAQSFYKRKQQVPVLLKEAYLYQLDEEGADSPKAQAPVSAQELREKMLSPEPTAAPVVKGGSVQPVVDLHIEKIRPDYARLSKADMLEAQLLVFEQQLEQAIATGMDEITFIHGVGNGVLRAELHRRLSRHQNVDFYKDAQKEKFGYGATLVKIK